MIPPIQYNYQHLPYSELPPDIFEELCLSLLNAKYGEDKCSYYGIKGQNQHGFDIYVRQENLYDLYQCKKYNKFNSSNLKDAIAIWESGSWTSLTRKFIIISSNSLTETSFLEEFERQKQRLSLSGIILEKIGSADLDRELKKNPSIVLDFFGLQWVTEFCLPELSRVFLQKQEVEQVVTKHEYPPVSFYIERKVHIPERKKGLEKERRITLFAFVKGCLEKLKPARVILKAEAAVGKSKELENIAHVFSAPETELVPILIRLKNYSGGYLEQYIDHFFNGWHLMPAKKALFLFDAIDEVEARWFGDFIKNFNLFLQSHPQSSIIASIRTNVFTKQIGSGIDEENRLTEMYLDGLNDLDISAYLQMRLSIENKLRKFSQLTSKKWMKELLLNPFYLCAFTDLFLEDENGMPNTKPDVIRKLIDRKMVQDKEKYESEMPLDEIEVFSKVLALFLTLTGKNSLRPAEVKSLTSITLKDLRRFSLFKVEESVNGDILSFEHNNFQEYLAASELAKLKWEHLRDILFHTKSSVMLKPKMVNIASFLFSLLPSNCPSFNSLLEAIKNSQQSLLLNFEKDKLDSASRLYIFKRIILTGKQEKIFFLRDDISPLELVQFISYSTDGLNFLLDELDPTGHSNYVYCILELIFFYPPEYSDSYLNKKLRKSIGELISTANLEYAVYDLAIDILTKFEFFSAPVLKTIKKCPMIEDKMVRGAAVKYIDKGGFKPEFQYVLQSANILAKEGVHAALEDLYLRYILKHLDRANVVYFFDYFVDNSTAIESFIRQSFHSESNRLIDKIYKKVAEMFVQQEDKELLTSVISFLIKIDYADYKTKEWGNPALLFSGIVEKQIYFWDLFLHEGFDSMDYLLKDFYDPAFAPSIMEKYREGSITKWHLLTLRRSLQASNFHDEFYSCLINTFGNEFQYQKQVDWEEINKSREIQNIALMKSRDFFLSEARKVFDILKYHGKGDINATIELQYSEKKEILKKLDNTIILDVILDYEIKGGLEEFSKHFSDEKGWRWFVFQYVHRYIARKKAHLLTKELLNAAQEFLNFKILPKINFKKAITEKEEGSFSINTNALVIVDFFRNDTSLFSDEIVLGFLHMDFDGFYHYPDETKSSDKQRLFELVYARVGREKFVAAVLNNLRSGKLPSRVKESHVFICRFYAITESILTLKNILSSRNATLRIKEEIIATIIELAVYPEVFDSTIVGWKTVRYEWQFLVCNHLGQYNQYQERITSLIESSVLIASSEDKESFWRFKLLTLGLELGSFKVFQTMLKLYRSQLTHHRLQINSSLFDALIKKDPLRVIKGSFEVMRILAPTFVEGHRSSIAEVLEEVIRNSVNDSEILFDLALSQYEKIISDNIDLNPRVSYFKWYEKRLIKNYYSKASRFESDGRALDVIKELELI